MTNFTPQHLRVSGSVNKVRYRAESGFTVLSATLKNEEGEDGDATVVGLMPPLDIGDSFTAEVSMEEHREYGYQYKVLNMVLEATPADLTEAGVAAYLEARVGGVGKVLARRIARILAPPPSRFSERRRKRCCRCRALPRHACIKWSRVGSHRGGSGVCWRASGAGPQHFAGAAGRQTLWRSGPGAPDQADLYALTEVEGIGFLTADKLATAHGMPHDDARRLTAAAVYALQQAAQQGGHSYLPRFRAERGVAHYTRVSQPRPPSPWKPPWNWAASPTIRRPC